MDRYSTSRHQYYINIIINMFCTLSERLLK